jgi:hypothetical protein
MKNRYLTLCMAMAIPIAFAAPSRAQLPRLEVHVAQEAPPRPKHERRTARPDRDSVWVPGAWDWQGSQWTWVAGRWDRPEERNARWVKPRYQHEGDAYRYEPGHWSNQQVVEGDEYRHWKEGHGKQSHDHKKNDKDGDNPHR